MHRKLSLIELPMNLEFTTCYLYFLSASCFVLNDNIQISSSQLHSIE